jgi:hypothetical protein
MARLTDGTGGTPALRLGCRRMESQSQNAIPVVICVGAVPCDRPKAGSFAMLCSLANMNRDYCNQPLLLTISIGCVKTKFTICERGQPQGAAPTKYCD